MALARSLPPPASALTPVRPRDWAGDGAALIAVTLLHGALLAGLMVARAPDAPEVEEPDRLEVELIAEAAPTSSAPVITPDSAPALGEPDGDAAPAPAAPEPTPTPPIPEPIAPPPPTPVRTPPPQPEPKPQPVKKADPAPAPKPKPKPTPKPAPAKPTPAKATPAKAAPTKIPPAKPTTTKAAATKAPATKAPVAKAASTKGPSAKAATSSAATKSGGARPTGRLDGIAASVAKTGANPAAKGAPAATTSAAVRKSIDVSIKGAVRQPWNQCRLTGVDIEKLSTEVRFRLTRAGALDAITGITTSGQTDSNRPQVARHQECARKAIQLAAPFTLPAEAYASWQNYTLDFVKK